MFGLDDSLESALDLGAGVIGAVLGLFLVQFLFSVTPKSKTATPVVTVTVTSRRWVLLQAAIALAVFAAINVFGMWQFGGFDHSALIETAWRMQQGQRPYIDFTCTVPVGFLLGAKYAFALFGVSWRALVLFHACYSALLFLWTARLLHKLIPNPGYALLLAIFVPCVSTVLVSYWWYNPMTTAAAVVFLLSALLFDREPQSRISWLSYVLSLALLASAKPNISAVLILGVTVTLFTSQLHRLKLLALSLTAFTFFVLALALHRIWLLDVIKSYLSISQRGFSLDQLFQDMSPGDKLIALATLAAVCVPLFLYRRSKESRWLLQQESWLLFVGFLAGLYGFLTNGEAKLVDLPLMFLAVAFYCPILKTTVTTHRGKRAKAKVVTTDSSYTWPRYLSVVACVLIAMGLFSAAARQRVKAIGPLMFYEAQTTSRPVENSFFDGLHTGNLFVDTVDQVTAVTTEAGAGSIYFGPRMQWGYAAYRIASPKGQPIWWHPGVSFEPKDERIYLDRFLAARFQTVILKRNDATYFTPGLLQILREHYMEDDSRSMLTVLHWRG